MLQFKCPHTTQIPANAFNQCESGICATQKLDEKNKKKQFQFYDENLQLTSELEHLTCAIHAHKKWKMHFDEL